MADPLLDRARSWLAQDPDPHTRAELAALVGAAEAGDSSPLLERFAGTLEFGTAGLRGELGAGPCRMNRVVVARAAAGLAAYLRGHGRHPERGDRVRRAASAPAVFAARHRRGHDGGRR
ncbi:MAG: hypothetical protein WKF83_13650 [Nocardioidaceae bacterium]